MGVVKTNHKRNATLRRVKRQVKQWDREDQAAEAAEVRRHNRAVKAHKMKRLYPNAITPTRGRLSFHVNREGEYYAKNQNGVVRMRLNRNELEYFDDRGKRILKIEAES